MATIQTNQEVTLRFNLKWSDKSDVDVRKQVGAEFTLYNPLNEEVPITDIGYDRLNCQIWVRIGVQHTANEGQYYGLLTCYDTALEHITTGKIVMFSASASASVLDPVLLTPTVSVIGSEGNVGDVLVNGESVVKDNVAYITTKNETHTFSQIYTNGTDLQKICKVNSGASLILRYSWYLNGRSYSDEVYYTSTNYPTDGYFYSHYHQDFIEARQTSAIPNCLCIKSKGAAAAPTATLSVEVLFCSGTITWYDGDDVVSPSDYDKVCEKIASTIDLSNSTNLTTDESGTIYNDAQVEVTSLEDGKTYTMNASASNGAFTIPARSDYSGTNIFMYGDGVATLNGIEYAYTSGQTLQLKEGIVVIEEEGKNYYTKEETDTMLSAETSARQTTDNALQSEIDEVATPTKIQLETEDTIEVVAKIDENAVPIAMTTVTSSCTIEPNCKYYVDTTDSSVTLTLPSSFSNGDWYQIYICGANACVINKSDGTSLYSEYNSIVDIYSNGTSLFYGIRYMGQSPI